MKNSEYLVSIILPVRNAKYYLTDCLTSLLKQTHANIEIIAIEDKSTDESFEILKQFKQKDKRLRVFKNKKNYGLAVCLNRAIKKAKGDFLAFTSAKDYSSKLRIQRQVSYLLNNPKVAVLGCQSTFIDKQNKRIGKSSLPIKHKEIYKMLLPGLSMQFESVMINRKLLPMDVLKFNRLSHPVLYTDIFLKLATYGEFANLPHFFHYHRKSTKTCTSDMGYLVSLAKVLMKSLDIKEYPTLRSILSPLTTRINTN